MHRVTGLGGFVWSRLLALPVVVLLVTLLVFWVFEQLADPALLQLGPLASPEALARRRHELGLDRPSLVRLAEFVRETATLRFGTSTHRGVPVRELVIASLDPTLSYAIPGLVGGTFVSLGLGLVAAQRRDGAIDRALVIGSTFLLSLSSLVVVLLAHDLFTHRVPILPASWPLTGARPTLVHLLMPACVWALLQVGPDLRHFRALWIAELEAPHHEAMLARGIPPHRRQIHALRGISGGVVARIGYRVPYLVLGSVVVEEILNIPGVGRLAVAALQHDDLPLMLGITVLLTATTILAQAATDLLSAWLDPRMRHS